MSKTDESIDEGYVKYVSHWIAGPAPDAAAVASLNEWRRPLFAAGLIGHYRELDVGYGNLSIRGDQPGQFIISGTQTGHIEDTTSEHYALVTNADIALNSVTSVGPVQASSEALTHAALYALSADINAVVHVHDDALWERYRDTLPTTDAAVAYGTPEMAREFDRLWHSTAFAARDIAVMAGHAGGLVSIGATLKGAARRMLNLQETG